MDGDLVTDPAEIDAVFARARADLEAQERHRSTRELRRARAALDALERDVRAGKVTMNRKPASGR